MKIEVESQMRKIRDMQQKKKALEEQEMMRRKQEILQQVLGVGGALSASNSSREYQENAQNKQGQGKQDMVMVLEQSRPKQLSSYKGTVEVLESAKNQRKDH